MYPKEEDTWPQAVVKMELTFEKKGTSLFDRRLPSLSVPPSKSHPRNGVLQRERADLMAGDRDYYRYSAGEEKRLPF